MENLFALAVRSKLRFKWNGLISAEDLWDLTVEQLDSIFKGLNAKLKEEQTDSLLETKTATNTTLDLQVKIIKHVVSVKLEEQEARSQAADKRQKRTKLLELIANKEDEELIGKSKEDLRAMLDEI